MTRTQKTDSTFPHRPRLGTAIILTLLGLAVYDQLASPPIDRELLIALVLIALTLLGYELDRLLSKWLNR